MKCPGQDSRFWSADDIFEVSCPACGADVEFFRDDPFRHCPGCGRCIQNPKMSLGCAEWCAYAQQCLGFDLESRQADAEQATLLDRLIEAARTAYGDDRDRFGRSLQRLARAQRLVRVRGGNPAIVMAASLLLEVDGPLALDAQAPLPGTRRVLAEVASDPATSQEVCAILTAFQDGRGMDSTEFKIVAEADRLVS